MSSAPAPAKPDGRIYRMEIAVPASVWPDLYAEPSPKQLAAISERLLDRLQKKSATDTSRSAS